MDCVNYDYLRKHLMIIHVVFLYTEVFVLSCLFNRRGSTVAKEEGF